jgi:hypothetical protein
MNAPGFNAEASLYRTSQYYYRCSRSSAAVRGPGQLWAIVAQ